MSPMASRLEARAVRGVALATLAGLFALVARSPGQAEEAAGPLRIAACGQSLGSLEPCECVDGMRGGYPRRLALLAKLRREETPLLLLDGGDLTGAIDHPRLLELQAGAALDLLAQAGASAVAVGERDLRLGAERLSRLAARAGVTLLACNLRRGEARPFGARVVLRRGGRTVAVTAALDPPLGDPTGELTIDPPGPAVRAALADAPAGALRVVLFHGDAAAARDALGELAAEGRIDVVLCGHDRFEALPLARLGGAWQVELLRDARALSVLALPGGDEREARLEHFPLDAHVPDDLLAQERVERYYRDAAGLPAPERHPVPGGGSFVGAAACQACHPGPWEQFVGSAHHDAQRKVLAKDPRRGRLAECTACHVTGYGFEGGFVDLEATPHLGEVGCEACHGVGGAHVARGGGRGYGVRPGFPESWRAVCVRCHDPTNSPGFDLERGLEAIRHWEPRERGR